MKIISELCQNHNGDRDLLEKMIKNAAVCSDIIRYRLLKLIPLLIEKSTRSIDLTNQSLLD